MKPAIRKTRLEKKERPARIRNFHLPLPADLYQELSAAAQGEGEPTTVLARRAIRFFLELRRKREVGRQVREFALKYAGTDVDFDSEWEEEGLRVWAAAEGKTGGERDR